MTSTRATRRRMVIAAWLMVSMLPLARSGLVLGDAPRPGETSSRPRPGETSRAPRPGESAAVTRAGVALAPQATAEGEAKPLSWISVMTFNFAYVKVDDAFKARLAKTPANRLKMLRKFAAFEAVHNLREQFRANAKAVVEAIDATTGNPPGGDPPPSDPPPSNPPPSDPPPSNPPPSDPPPSNPPPSDPPPSDPPPSDPPPSDPPPSSPPPSDPPPSDPPPSDPPPSNPPPSDPPPADPPPPSAAPDVPPAAK